jgi:hypothetical protein
MLSNHKWLHGGIKIVNEVCMALLRNKAYFMIRIFDVDSQVDSGQAAKKSIGETV